MMIFLLRGASTAKQSQGLSGAQSPALGTERGSDAWHVVGPPEAGLYSADYFHLAFLLAE